MAKVWSLAFQFKPEISVKNLSKAVAQILRDQKFSDFWIDKMQVMEWFVDPDNT